MSEIFYSSETEAKKKELGTYFENIVGALDNINKIKTSDSWQCAEGTNLDTKFEELKGKISSIKETITSYENFLGIVKTTYEATSEEIDDAVSTYANASE